MKHEDKTIIWTICNAFKHFTEKLSFIVSIILCCNNDNESDKCSIIISKHLSV